MRHEAIVHRLFDFPTWFPRRPADWFLARATWLSESLQKYLGRVSLEQPKRSFLKRPHGPRRDQFQELYPASSGQACFPFQSRTSHAREQLPTVAAWLGLLPKRRSGRFALEQPKNARLQTAAKRSTVHRNLMCAHLYRPGTS